MFNVNLGTIGGPGPYPPPVSAPVCVCILMWNRLNGRQQRAPIWLVQYDPSYGSYFVPQLYAREVVNYFVSCYRHDGLFSCKKDKCLL